MGVLVLSVGVRSTPIADRREAKSTKMSDTNSYRQKGETVLASTEKYKYMYRMPDVC